jgi:hypothetical protein
MVVARKIESQEVTIPAPKFEVANFLIEGTAPLVMHKFSAKMRGSLKGYPDKVRPEGPEAKPKREVRNSDDLLNEAMHKSREGWAGIPAGTFRHALISACRIVNFKMTMAKLCVFIIADGYDNDEGTPLVKITKGKPHKTIMTVRVANGAPDVCVRPMWDEGWQAMLRIRYDAGMFSATAITNLVHRAGLQSGICEGRPDSPNSPGMGWGTFKIVNPPKETANV